MTIRMGIRTLVSVWRQSLDTRLDGLSLINDTNLEFKTHKGLDTEH